MNSEEIKYHALNAAKNYYKYQEENGTAHVEVQVVFIREEKNNFVFTLNKDLVQDISNYKLFIDENYIEAKDYKILKYDDEDRELYISFNPKSELHLTFEKVKFESDLLFLTENLVKWYEDPQHKINLPSTLPRLPDFPLSEKYTPAQSQIESINNIKNHSLSYVWGAPGTGKTKFVLAHCIAQYIQKFQEANSKQKVLVCAPTNNALEQILFGVLKVLDDEKLPTDVVLRLGMPSKKFAHQYPNSCENISLHNYIEKIKNKINELIELEIKRREITELNFFNLIFDNFTTELEEQILKAKNIKEKHDLIVNTINKQNDELKSLTTELNQIATRINETKKEKSKLKNRIRKNKKGNLEFHMAVLIAKRQDIEKLIEEKNICIKQLKQSLKDTKNTADSSIDIKNIKTRLFAFLKKHNNSKNSAINSLLNYLRSYIDDDIDIFLKLAIKKCYNIIEENKDFIAHSKYNSMNNCEIQEKINKLNCELEKLSSQDIDIQIADANIIALTIDRFVLNYSTFQDLMKKNEYMINQIFVDEAAYMSLIKGLPLFSFDVPIALLGDHMQLPPVFDSKDSFERNHPELLFCKYPIIYCGDIFEIKYEELIKNKDYAPRFFNISKTNLDITYRFGYNLAKTLCGIVYSNNFSSANSTEPIRILVINVERAKDESYKKRINKKEISAIIDLVEIFSHKFGTTAVLTPYKNQLNKLNQKFQNKIICSTIHASQGQEWDTVIISTVDSFLASKTKIINTAVSRAKKNLVILCNTKIWDMHPEYLLSKIISIADYIIDYTNDESFKEIKNIE